MFNPTTKLFLPILSSPPPHKIISNQKKNDKHGLSTVHTYAIDDLRLIHGHTNPLVMVLPFNKVTFMYNLELEPVEEVEE